MLVQAAFRARDARRLTAADAFSERNSSESSACSTTAYPGTPDGGNDDGAVSLVHCANASSFNELRLGHGASMLWSHVPHAYALALRAELTI